VPKEAREAVFGAIIPIPVDLDLGRNWSAISLEPTSKRGLTARDADIDYLASRSRISSGLTYKPGWDTCDLQVFKGVENSSSGFLVGGL